MSTPPRSCGSCSLCCKVMGIVELDKPMGVWCSHFKAGAGCRVYDDRPPTCRSFQCMWLISPTMPDAVRPDRTKVVLTIENGGASIIARADPADPDAWRREPIHGQLRRWAADSWFKQRTIWAMVDRRAWLIAPDRDIELGEIETHSRTTYEQTPDGTITVTVMPPTDAGQGLRVVSRRP